jgi:uncharacterized protein (DUF2267 family)
VISVDAFVGRVMRTGKLDQRDAYRATYATIRALGEVLDEPLGRALHAALPHRMALMILANAPRRKPSDFVSRVCAHEGRSLGTAKEHCEIVCRVLGQTLDWDLVVRMGKDLKRPDLFESPVPEAAHV